MSKLPPVTLRLFGTLLVVLSQGCHSLPGTARSSGEFAIAITRGAVAEYTWADGGALSVLVAPRNAPTRFVWGIADTSRGLRSPLAYGTLPPGAVPLIHPATALRAGAEYRVTVTLPDGRVASQDFRATFN